MKTTETTIIIGSNEELEKVMEADTALVVDHRSDEEEVLSEIHRFLPDFSFTHEFEDGGCRVAIRFNGKEQKKEYREIPHNSTPLN